MQLILSPLSWLLLAALLACLPLQGRYRRALRLTGCALALVAALAMTPWFANLLLGRLENAERASLRCVRSPPSIAVVMAGGVTARASRPDDVAVLGLASRRRLDRAVAWWRERDGRRLVMSGGNWFGDGVSDAELMSRYAQALGVPASAIALEPHSRTTWDSARRLARMRPGLPARLVLVTSALHARRAAYAMRGAGFEVCAVAADRQQVQFELPGSLVPQRSALAKTESALHEIVGLAWYRWRAWRESNAVEPADAGR